MTVTNNLFLTLFAPIPSSKDNADVTNGFLVVKSYSSCQVDFYADFSPFSRDFS
jgi:hypothetical protein